jgi:antitoxin component YwqK of YwqJK toxin-antitoxin module
MTLVIGTCLGQDTLDTVRNGEVTYLYKKGVIQEKIYFKGDQIDIKVIYVYREGVLVRREWWQRGKMISYALDN